MVAVNVLFPISVISKVFPAFDNIPACADENAIAGIIVPAVVTVIVPSRIILASVFADADVIVCAPAPEPATI